MDDKVATLGGKLADCDCTMMMGRHWKTGGAFEILSFSILIVYSNNFDQESGRIMNSYRSCKMKARVMFDCNIKMFSVFQVNKRERVSKHHCRDL